MSKQRRLYKERMVESSRGSMKEGLPTGAQQKSKCRKKKNERPISSKNLTSVADYVRLSHSVKAEETITPAASKYLNSGKTAALTSTIKEVKLDFQKGRSKSTERFPYNTSNNKSPEPSMYVERAFYNTHDQNINKSAHFIRGSSKSSADGRVNFECSNSKTHKRLGSDDYMKLAVKRSKTENSEDNKPDGSVQFQKICNESESPKETSNSQNREKSKDRKRDRTISETSSRSTNESSRDNKHVYRHSFEGMKTPAASTHLNSGRTGAALTSRTVEGQIDIHKGRSKSEERFPYKTSNSKISEPSMYEDRTLHNTHEKCIDNSPPFQRDARKSSADRRANFESLNSKTNKRLGSDDKMKVTEKHFKTESSKGNKPDDNEEIHAASEVSEPPKETYNSENRGKSKDRKRNRTISETSSRSTNESSRDNKHVHRHSFEEMKTPAASTHPNSGKTGAALTSKTVEEKLDVHKPRGKSEERFPYKISKNKSTIQSVDEQSKTSAASTHPNSGKTGAALNSRTVEGRLDFEKGRSKSVERFAYNTSNIKNPEPRDANKYSSDRKVNFESSNSKTNKRLGSDDHMKVTEKHFKTESSKGNKPDDNEEIHATSEVSEPSKETSNSQNREKSKDRKRNRTISETSSRSTNESSRDNKHVYRHSFEGMKTPAASTHPNSDKTGVALTSTTVDGKLDVYKPRGKSEERFPYITLSKKSPEPREAYKYSPFRKANFKLSNSKTNKRLGSDDHMKVTSKHFKTENSKGNKPDDNEEIHATSEVSEPSKETSNSQNGRKSRDRKRDRTNSETSSNSTNERSRDNKHVYRHSFEGMKTPAASTHPNSDKTGVALTSTTVDGKLDVYKPRGKSEERFPYKTLSKKSPEPREAYKYSPFRKANFKLSNSKTNKRLGSDDHMKVTAKHFKTENSKGNKPDDNEEIHAASEVSEPPKETYKSQIRGKSKDHKRDRTKSEGLSSDKILDSIKYNRKKFENIGQTKLDNFKTENSCDSRPEDSSDDSTDSSNYSERTNNRRKKVHKRNSGKRRKITQLDSSSEDSQYEHNRTRLSLNKGDNIPPIVQSRKHFKEDAEIESQHEVKKSDIVKQVFRLGIYKKSLNKNCCKQNNKNDFSESKSDDKSDSCQQPLVNDKNKSINCSSENPPLLKNDKNQNQNFEIVQKIKDLFYKNFETASNKNENNASVDGSSDYINEVDFTRGLIIPDTFTCKSLHSRDTSICMSDQDISYEFLLTENGLSSPTETDSDVKKETVDVVDPYKLRCLKGVAENNRKIRKRRKAKKTRKVRIKSSNQKLNNLKQDSTIDNASRIEDGISPKDDSLIDMNKLCSSTVAADGEIRNQNDTICDARKRQTENAQSSSNILNLSTRQNILANDNENNNFDSYTLVKKKDCNANPTEKSNDQKSNTEKNNANIRAMSLDEQKCNTAENNTVIQTNEPYSDLDSVLPELNAETNLQNLNTKKATNRTHHSAPVILSNSLFQTEQSATQIEYYSHLPQSTPSAKYILKDPGLGSGTLGTAADFPQRQQNDLRVTEKYVVNKEAQNIFTATCLCISSNVLAKLLDNLGGSKKVAERSKSAEGSGRDFPTTIAQAQKRTDPFNVKCNRNDLANFQQGGITSQAEQINEKLTNLSPECQNDNIKMKHSMLNHNSINIVPQKAENAAFHLKRSTVESIPNYAMRHAETLNNVEDTRSVIRHSYMPHEPHATETNIEHQTVSGPFNQFPRDLVNQSAFLTRVNPDLRAKNNIMVNETQTPVNVPYNYSRDVMHYSDEFGNARRQQTQHTNATLVQRVQEYTRTETLSPAFRIAQNQVNTHPSVRSATKTNNVYMDYAVKSTEDQLSPLPIGYWGGRAHNLNQANAVPSNLAARPAEFYSAADRTCNNVATNYNNMASFRCIPTNSANKNKDQDINAPYHYDLSSIYGTTIYHPGHSGYGRKSENYNNMASFRCIPTNSANKNKDQDINAPYHYDLSSIYGTTIYHPGHSGYGRKSENNSQQNLVSRDYPGKLDMKQLSFEFSHSFSFFQPFLTENHPQLLGNSQRRSYYLNLQYRHYWLSKHLEKYFQDMNSYQQPSESGYNSTIYYQNFQLKPHCDSSQPANFNFDNIMFKTHLNQPLNAFKGGFHQFQIHSDLCPYILLSPQSTRYCQCNNEQNQRKALQLSKNKGQGRGSGAGADRGRGAGRGRGSSRGRNKSAAMCGSMEQEQVTSKSFGYYQPFNQAQSNEKVDTDQNTKLMLLTDANNRPTAEIGNSFNYILNVIKDFDIGSSSFYAMYFDNPEILIGQMSST